MGAASSLNQKGHKITTAPKGNDSENASLFATTEQAFNSIPGRNSTTFNCDPDLKTRESRNLKSASFIKGMVKTKDTKPQLTTSTVKTISPPSPPKNSLNGHTSNKGNFMPLKKDKEERKLIENDTFLGLEQMIEVVNECIPFYEGGETDTDQQVRETIGSLPQSALEVPDAYGNTMILIACQHGAYDLIPIFLDKGSNVNARNNDGATCLHFACYPDSLSIQTVELLLRSGAIADVAENVYGCTPLHWAASAGNIELCEILCIAGADPRKKDLSGNDAISYAVGSKVSACIDFFEYWFLENTNNVSQLVYPWIQCLDENTGERYYFNKETKESLWEDEYTEAENGKRKIRIERTNVDNANSSSPRFKARVKKTKSLPLVKYKEQQRLLNCSRTSLNKNYDSDSRQINDKGSAGRELQYSYENNEQELHHRDSFQSDGSHTFDEKLTNLQTSLETRLMDQLRLLESKLVPQTSRIEEADYESRKRKDDTILEMGEKIIKLQAEVGEKDLIILNFRRKLQDMDASDNLCNGSCDRANTSINSELMTELKEELQEKNLRLDDLNTMVVNLRKELKTSHHEMEMVKARNTRDEEKMTQLRRELEEARMEKDESVFLSGSSKKEAKKSSQNNGAKDKVTIAKLQSEIERLEEELFMSSVKHSKEIENERLIAEEAQTKVFSLEDVIAKFKSEFVGEHEAKIRSQMAEINKWKKEVENEKIARTEKEIELSEARIAIERAIQAENKARIDSEGAIKQLKDAEEQLGSFSSVVAEAKSILGQNEKLHQALLAETSKRKELHNKLEDLKGKIRVYVRIRPFSKSEEERNCQEILLKEDSRTCTMTPDPGKSESKKNWEFDQIFSGTAEEGNTQDAVFQDTKLLITSAVDGFNVCIFAYGQTGSGKTFTMFGGCKPGTEIDENGNINPYCGLASRAALELFRVLREKESGFETSVTVSMFELYNDHLRDLLNTEEGDRTSLKVRLAEHSGTGMVEVENSIKEVVHDGSALLKLLQKGLSFRTTASTQMNSDSSRSHLIVMIQILLTNSRTRQQIRGKLALVDLAGSERVGKTGACGIQLKEAQSINKSLSALGDVISALTSGNKHIPYRNHPLTTLMSDSVGGTAKTLMFLCCSPADYNRFETGNSLDFAQRCKDVKNKNAIDGNDQTSQIKALKAQLTKMKKEKGDSPKPSAGLMKKPSSKTPVKNLNAKNLLKNPI